jgi:hypothetical protein
MTSTITCPRCRSTEINSHNHARKAYSAVEIVVGVKDEPKKGAAAWPKVDPMEPVAQS